MCPDSVLCRTLIQFVNTTIFVLMMFLFTVCPHSMSFHNPREFAVLLQAYTISSRVLQHT